MSKELETLEKLISFAFVMSENMIGLTKGNYDENQFIKKTYEYLHKYNVDLDSKLKLKKSLQRLETIDNSNPSKALECLEKVYSRLPQWDLSRNVDQCNIIKQALLKAQESKKYLTWEDLDFKEEEQTMKVLLNGEEYKLSYFTDGITEYVDLLAGNGKYQMGRYVDCYPTDVKFFNDLHLEEILKEDKSE